uniref:Uncharacterized protein n=1 Tax=viral metagenome TaxID=1070528 RepID=A0A6H2A226_9ZZZZ
MSEQISIVSGEPIIYEDRVVTTLECCDCGLVHLVQVKIKNNKAILRFYKNDYETDKIRKEEKIVLYRRDKTT